MCVYQRTGRWGGGVDTSPLPAAAASPHIGASRPSRRSSRPHARARASGSASAAACVPRASQPRSTTGSAWQARNGAGLRVAAAGLGGTRGQGGGGSQNQNPTAWGGGVVGKIGSGRIDGRKDQAKSFNVWVWSGGFHLFLLKTGPEKFRHLHKKPVNKWCMFIFMYGDTATYYILFHTRMTLL